MTRFAAVLAALAVAACGGSSTDAPAQYAFKYTVSICSCTAQQVGRCIDIPTASGSTSGNTCHESIDGLGEVHRGWAYSSSPCPTPDCRMVGGPPADGGCNFQVECVNPF